jgi:hypothetical protein
MTHKACQNNKQRLIGNGKETRLIRVNKWNMTHDSIKNRNIRVAIRVRAKCKIGKGGRAHLSTQRWWYKQHPPEGCTRTPAHTARYRCLLDKNQHPHTRKKVRKSKHNSAMRKYDAR